MLLEDATSKEQVEAALAAGDEELREDINEQLSVAKRRWEQDGYACETEEWSFSEWATDNEVFAEEIVKQSPQRFDLSGVPIKFIRDAVNYQIGRVRSGIFHLYERPRYSSIGFHYSVELEMHCRFDSSDAPEGAEYIPEDIAKEFWEDLGYGVEWEETDRIGENFGYRRDSGESVDIYITEEDFDEFCRDIRSEYIQSVRKEKPKDVVPLFLDSLKSYSSDLYNKLVAKKFSKDVLLKLADWWYETEENGEDPSEMLKSCIDDPHEGEEREVVATFSKEEIRSMGITSGPLLEEAPWTLVKLLPPSDTCMESVFLGHCVGDMNMGYNDAIERGEIEIWSLRSRFGKPRFTLEVDTNFYNESVPTVDIRVLPGSKRRPMTDGDRANAIKQIKGKGNRTPGYERANLRGPEVRFPDEVIFWRQVFKDIGVDPEGVDDFDAARDVPALERNVSRNATRSFDEPYEPM